MAKFTSLKDRYQIKFKRNGRQRKFSVKKSDYSRRSLADLELKMNQAFASGAWNPDEQSWLEFVGDPNKPPELRPDAFTGTLEAYVDEFLDQVKADIMPSSYITYSACLRAFIRDSLQIRRRPLSTLNNELLTRTYEEYVQSATANHKNLMRGLVNKLLAYVEYKTGYSYQLIKRRSFRMSGNRAASGQSFERIKYISEPALLGIIESLQDGAIAKLGFGLDYEYQQYIDILSNAYAMMFYQTMRYVEFSRLTWDDIDLDKGLITLCGKGAKYRRVPITFKGSQHIKRLKQACEASNAVFGLSYQRMVNTFKQLMQMRYNFEGRFGLHMLRHGGATYMLNNGMPLKELSEFMGHSSISQSEAYAKIMAGRLQDVVNMYG